MTSQHDHITVVLRQCEEQLRILASQGRLPNNALAAFGELAGRVRQEIERRQGDERRAVARLHGDRRVANAADARRAQIRVTRDRTSE